MRRAFAVLFLGVAVSIGATACGSGKSSSNEPVIKVTSKSIYEQKMQLLNQQLDSVMLAVSNANNSQTAQGTPLPAKTEAENLQIAQNGMETAAGKLAKIVPPADIKAAHALLLKGLREDAAELTPVIAALKKGGDPLKVLPSVLTLKGLQIMRTASVEIEKAGYDILGTGTQG
jgi:hypothetical protein